MENLPGLEEWLRHLQHWHWWILAVILIILEVTLPAFFFLWLGIAAGIVGFLVLLFPGLGWEGQILWFSALSLIATGIWHLLLKKKPTATDQPTLNRRGNELIGRTFTLDDPMVNGMGRIRTGDSTWLAYGPDLPAGSKVVVIEISGTALKVVEELTAS